MPIMTFMTRYYHSFVPPHRSFSVIYKIFKIIRLSLVALAILAINSCEEGATNIGSDLLPGSDFVSIGSTDTLSVLSYTMFDEAVRTENPSTSYLGHIYDPYFGTTTAEFVTEIRMAGEWDDLPFFIDSVRLFLTLLDVKGVESDIVHTLRISEIADQIYTDSAYYSNTIVPLAGYELSDIELPILKPDTINQIVINLPVEFGEYLTRDTSKLFHSNTKPDFRSFFHGIYFSLNPSPEPLIVSLSLSPPTTIGGYENVLALYMHDDADATKVFYFILDATNRNASFNLFSHDFASADPGKRIEHINDGYPDTLSYLQYLNGVYTRLVLPGLEILKNDPSFDNIGVNKARITIPVFFDGDLYKASTAPPQLYLRYKTRSGSKYIVPDYNLDQYADFFDGRIDSTNNVYKFNIAAFAQRYFEDLTDEILPELEVFQFSGTRNVILKANDNTSPVKFEFTYTKF